MNPIMSKDGAKRANVRVTFRLGVQDFANILCLLYREYAREDWKEISDLSRSKIDELVRQQLVFNADARHWWRDDVEDDDAAEELWKRALEVVERKFPEFC